MESQQHTFLQSGGRSFIAKLLGCASVVFTLLYFMAGSDDNLAMFNLNGSKRIYRFFLTSSKSRSQIVKTIHNEMEVGNVNNSNPGGTSVQSQLLTNNYSEEIIATRLTSCLSPYFLLPEQEGFHLESFPPTLYEEKKIFRCTIPKNLATQSKALRCRMNTNNSLIDTKIAANPSAIKSKECKKLVLDLAGADKERVNAMYNSSDWFKFAVIRDPIDRFISGYLDRCVREQLMCYGCKDIACFAKKTYARFLQVKKLEVVHVGQLPEFTDHVFPQWWYCKFSQHYKEFHLLYYNKSESFAREYRRNLVNWGYPPELILSGWGKNKSEPFLVLHTAHTNQLDDGDRYRNDILSNLPTLNNMFLLYIVDYVKFNLEAPFKPIVDDLCANDPEPNKYQICQAFAASDCGKF